MSEISAHLRDKLEDLPTKPGVYIMKDDVGKIIYIGKAKILRNRVRTYFAQAPEINPKVAALKSKIADFELIVTDNEIEALILEANLVKKHKPRYNINLKDDKRYPFLMITQDDDFPRLVVTRTMRRGDGIYFGPYANVGGMRETYKMITRLFKLRTCKLKIPHPKGEGRYKVCLQYHIKRCDGPCVGLQSKADYDKEVQKVIKLLQGKSASLIDQLQVEMKQLALDQNYEEAARVRDQIRTIEAIMQKQKVVADHAVNRDIIAFARSGGDIAAVVLQLRDGLLIGRQNFHLKADAGDNESDIAESFFKQYYLSSTMVPEEVYSSFQPEDEKLIQQWLTQRRGDRVELQVPQKGEKLRLVEMAEANARLLLQELLKQRRERAGKLPAAVAMLQKDLYLTTPPVNIVCFDISNLGPADPVGSMVFFRNGKPLKRNYRHFKIKTVVGQDDFAMMREIVARYFTRVLTDEAEMPDLCIIDGGRGQLGAALEALKEVGINDLQICGLAKRLEEIVLPGEKRMLSLPRTSPSLKLMQAVRNEAHRFAITYHRSLRDKKTERSLLDAIAGIGDKRKEQLLKSFGSLEAIRAADVEAINLIVKNKPLAQKIVNFFQAQSISPER
ncbi:MAG: excinuclease ABC subunit UvrC [candidate division Zixibacteria bacterium]|nr:excinuclease ABC subunit UvrC [candidate division Zixibacteria bacterium]